MRASIAGAALLAGATVCLAGPKLAAKPPVKLTPAEIQSTFFTGAAFTASTQSNVAFSMVFTPDGKATRTPTGKGGSKGAGTWKMSEDGFCTAWGKGGKPNCFTI